MSMNKDLAKLKEGNKADVEELMYRNRLEKLFLEDRDSEFRYGLHASAVLGCLKDNFCYREQVLSLFYEMNQGEQLPNGTLRIFAQGNATHEKWYKLFRKAHIDVAIERTLFLKKYDLSFTIDALLEMFGEEVICDVKSMNTFQFKHCRSHPSGEAQVNFYMWALTEYEKNRSGKKYKKGFVLVEDKNDQNFKPIPVHYDKEKVKPVIECLREIQTMKQIFITKKEAPRRICKGCDCKRALTCGMRDACWNIGKGRRKIPKELIESRYNNG